MAMPQQQLLGSQQLFIHVAKEASGLRQSKTIAVWPRSCEGLRAAFVSWLHTNRHVRPKALKTWGIEVLAVMLTHFPCSNSTALEGSPKGPCC